MCNNQLNQRIRFHFVIASFEKVALQTAARFLEIDACLLTTIFGCDNGPLQQRWINSQVVCPIIFKDAEELSASMAMTTSGSPSPVPSVHFVSGGWVRAQNSSANPDRSGEVDFTLNYANKSGETLLFFANYLQSHPHTFGFGENVSFLVGLASRIG